MWVEKVVTFLELSLSSRLWYPLFISRCENTVEPLSSLTTSSIVGCCVCLRGIAWFATRMSTFRRIWLWSFLGVTTGGDTHPVGLLTFSMMSWSRRCCISSYIFWRTLNGWRRGGCATGLKSGSTFKLTWIPFSFPIPSTRSLYSSKMSFTLLFSSGWLLSFDYALVTSIIPRSFPSL